MRRRPASRRPAPIGWTIRSTSWSGGFLCSGGLTARVVALDAGAIGPGARLAGRELAVLGPPALSDNFEGIAARRGPDGGVLLYLVADDNFTALLRTVVLQFAVRPDASGRPEAPRRPGP